MPEARPARVLCLEDDPGLARLIQKRLERAGYVVDVATNGREGLARCAAQEYDVLTVDQQMPEVSGLEVIATLAAQDALPPTIMVTGAGSEETAVEAMRLGAGDYVVKDTAGGYLELLPVVIEQLLARQRLWDEKERALAALRESEARYRQLFEDMPVGLYRTTREGRFLDANPALVEMLGYPDRRSLMGTHVGDLYAEPNGRESWRQQLAAQGDRGSCTLRLRRRDGQLIWVEDVSRAFRGRDGRVKYYEGSLVDITARKRAEQALQEYSQRLEEMVEERTHKLRQAQEQLLRREKLAVLGQLAGSVSHELRGPLAVIASATQALEMALPEVDETVGQFLDMIAGEVKTADKIISDLLDFSRTQAPRPQQVQAAKLVAEALRRHPPPPEVEVVTRLPDLPPLLVDVQQMIQVLSNLITNAYQAMPDGGRLTIEAEARAGQVVLSISDTGCGMDEAHLARLFEPLFTTKSRGIGLGMSVVKMLLERNGGQIEVASTPGEGTTFTLRLRAGSSKPCHNHTAVERLAPVAVGAGPEADSPDKPSA